MLCIARGWWQESPITRESTKEAVKTIRAGKAGLFRCTCGDLLVSFFIFGREAAGAQSIRLFLRPLFSRDTISGTTRAKYAAGMRRRDLVIGAVHPSRRPLARARQDEAGASLNPHGEAARHPSRPSRARPLRMVQTKKASPTGRCLASPGEPRGPDRAIGWLFDNQIREWIRPAEPLLAPCLTRRWSCGDSGWPEDSTCAWRAASSCRRA
jgi:hypothetical protein